MCFVVHIHVDVQKICRVVVESYKKRGLGDVAKGVSSMLEGTRRLGCVASQCCEKPMYARRERDTWWCRERGMRLSGG